jgi:hypothetical protein
MAIARRAIMKAKHAPLLPAAGPVDGRCRAARNARWRPAADPAHRPDRRLFDAHPDLFWRSMAQRAEQDKQPARALVYYKRSARYADKFSQAMVARLYQEGIGTAPTR